MGMNNAIKTADSKEVELAESDARLTAREEQIAYCNLEINREWTERSEGWQDRVSEYQRILGY